MGPPCPATSRGKLSPVIGRRVTRKSKTSTHNGTESHAESVSKRKRAKPQLTIKLMADNPNILKEEGFTPRRKSKRIAVSPYFNDHVNGTGFMAIEQGKVNEVQSPCTEMLLALDSSFLSSLDLDGVDAEHNLVDMKSQCHDSGIGLFPMCSPVSSRESTKTQDSQNSFFQAGQIGDRIRRSLLRNSTAGLDDTVLSDLHLSGIPEGSIPPVTLPDSFCGLPKHVGQVLKDQRGITELYDWQKECLNMPGVQSGRNLLLCLPTSGGKTLVAEILLLKQILSQKKNAMLVLPYVSIVQEKVRAMAPFALALDFLIEEYAGGKGGFPPKKRRNKQSLYIATIEKAQGVVNTLLEAGRLEELGLVVVDEVHMLGEGSRGALLENLITKLHLAGKGIIQIIGMSATISNLQQIKQFLDADLYTCHFRPVELKEFIKMDNGIYEKVTNEAMPLCLLRQICPPYGKKEQSLDPDLVGALVMEVIPDHSCLIFCPTKKNCENVAQLLCKILPIAMQEINKDARGILLKGLKNENAGLICPVLKKTIPFGIAYHHSGLTTDERRLIEEAYLDGTLCVICCTSTLAAGVNLPARRVILRSPYVGKDFISRTQYKQMSGRAGRAGLDSTGESFLMCSPKEALQVANLISGPVDCTLSSLGKEDGQGLCTFVLSIIALNIANNLKNIEMCVAKTLYAIQAEELKADVFKEAKECLCWMAEQGLLTIKKDGEGEMMGNQKDLQVIDKENHKPNQEDLRISRLGKAAIRGCVPLSRAKVLYQDLCKGVETLVLDTALHLLYLVTPYDYVDLIEPVASIYSKKYMSLQEADLRVAQIVGINEAAIVRLMTKGTMDTTMRRFYVALILYDMWNQHPIWYVADRYMMHRGLVQNLLTSASSFASNVLHFVEELEELWALKQLLMPFTERLAYCVTAELLPLMELPAVKKGRARQLYQAGYRSLEDVAKAGIQNLVRDIEHLSRKTAQQIITSAKVLLMEKAESLKDEAEQMREVLRAVDANSREHTNSC